MSLFISAYAHGALDGPAMPSPFMDVYLKFSPDILACLLLARLESGGGLSTNEALEGLPHLKVTNGLRFL
jgi:hypothetical protein